jgi:enoyl-CoA hydratase/carnithine racemase
LLACDVRIASSHARLGLTQGRFYVPPGWGGLTRLVERVGRGRALWWLGAERILCAEEAHRAGLVEVVCSPEALEAEARALAGQLMRQDRAMIGALKRNALAAVSAGRAAAMADELEAFVAFWMSPEHHRRVEAFLARG